MSNKKQAGIFQLFLYYFFIPNERGFVWTSRVLLFLEAIISLGIIKFVPYTEIDWKTYMQQVECYTKKKIYNYSMIEGDTGPVVYPGGHLILYNLLYHLTNRGTNIEAAQYIFMFFYLLNLYFVFRIFKKTQKVPPFVLVFVTLTGYRIHSIFMLRLFNDPVAMLLFYAAVDRFLERKWAIGCVLYSFAVSIKMNILLFAPAMFFLLLFNKNFWSTIGYIVICGAVQLYTSLPFIAYDWKSYVVRSFDLGRVFMFKWTVNWRFLPEELFVDKRFHIALLIGHVTFLAIFAYYMWYRRLNGMYWTTIILLQNVTTSTGAHEAFYTFCTANLIGIAFSRSLHYQFYSWYYHQLPFLLFFNYSPKTTIDNIPWISIVLKGIVLLLVELCWNVYPSTWWSSGLLHCLHFGILYYLIATRSERPIDAIRKSGNKRREEMEKVENQRMKKEEDRINRNQNRISLRDQYKVTYENSKIKIAGLPDPEYELDQMTDNEKWIYLYVQMREMLEKMRKEEEKLWFESFTRQMKAFSEMSSDDGMSDTEASCESSADIKNLIRLQSVYKKSARRN